MSKVDHIARILTTRIKNGDYALHSMPPIRQLCTELSVNHITLRKSIKALLERGLLIRGENGRFTVATHSPGSLTTARIAMLSPAFSSPFLQSMKFLIEHVAREFMAEVIVVDYIHWDDPVIIATLNKFNGVFVIPTSEKMPEHVEDLFVNSTCPVVMIDYDMSDKGVVSLKLLTLEHIVNLIGHLVDLGHKKIDCLNTHPFDRVSQERIAGWELALKKYGVNGQLIDTPVEPYQQPMHKAYDVVERLWGAGRLTGTALFCTVQATAIGAMRAFKDDGVEVGRQISVCAGADEGLGEYLHLSLTSIKLPDIKPQIHECIQWFVRGGRWEHDMYWQPKSVSIFTGESTGPVMPEESQVSAPRSRKLEAILPST